MEHGKERSNATALLERVNNEMASKRVFYHPVSWVPALVGAVLAFADSPVIANSWFISLLADFSSHYTGIDDFVASHAFPDAAKSFYAIIFSAFPFQFVLLGMKWKDSVLPIFF